MTVEREDREQRRIKQLANEYRKKGYEVLVEPGPEKTPEFLRPFRPDLIIRKGEEAIVVEVKTTESLTASKDIEKIAEAVASRHGWKFKLVVTNPRIEPERVPEVAAASLTQNEVSVLLKRVERLVRIGEMEAALLLLVAAIESVLREAAKKEGIPLRGKTLLHGAKHLLSYAVIGRRDYDAFERIFKTRNFIIHGFRAGPIKQKLIMDTVKRLKDILGTSERETIRKIREVVRSGKLPEKFTPAHVNKVLKIDWAGTFLPKHRVGNPGGYTGLFVRVGKGLYKLKSN